MNRPNTALLPLNKQNETHLQLMYEVRTHPAVASRLSGIPPADYKQHLHYLTNITNKTFFIIIADHIPCGYCQATTKQNEIELGWALHPTWWGKSIGSTAVKLLIDHAKKHYPSHSIYLTVKKDNPAAIHIYKKNGFIIQNTDSLHEEYIMHLVERTF
jgi:RimJ/RimL family protein N-acetyltransferase